VKHLSRPWAKSFLIRFALAVIIFAAVYAGTVLDGVWGSSVRTGVEYLLTKNYDLSGYLTRLSQLIPELPFLDGQPDLEVEVSTAGRFPDLPVSGKLVKGFGWQRDENDWPVFIPGIELAVDKGAACRAVLPGEVVHVGTDKSLGRIVIIEHDKNCATLYGRLGEIGVKAGQEVVQGQVIGSIEGAYFHFQVREGEQLVDPLTRIQ
jgi:murein DD-endopeptidase MepM/ murein hydrolase activator NlpD